MSISESPMQNSHLPYFSLTFKFLSIQIYQIMNCLLKKNVLRDSLSQGYPYFCQQNLSVEHLVFNISNNLHAELCSWQLEQAFHITTCRFSRLSV